MRVTREGVRGVAVPVTFGSAVAKALLVTLNYMVVALFPGLVFGR
jgi:hypothetical protein